MTAGDIEAVSRELSTALNQASLSAIAADADRGLVGAHPVFYAASRPEPSGCCRGANSLTGRSPWYVARRCRPDLPRSERLRCSAGRPVLSCCRGTVCPDYLARACLRGRTMPPGTARSLRRAGVMKMMSKSRSRRFTVTVTHLPVTRCQICHRTVAYPLSNISDVLTGHYRRAHPEVLAIPSR
jgi:hypothetical protein